MLLLGMQNNSMDSDVATALKNTVDEIRLYSAKFLEGKKMITYLLFINAMI